MGRTFEDLLGRRALLAFVVLLVGCGILLERSCARSIPGYRCPLEFTADPAPHIVQLFGPILEPGRKARGMFQLRLPKSWATCSFNHTYTRQQEIELVFDRHTLEPLTEIVARENRIDVLHDFFYQMNRYRDRQLWVSIRQGNIPNSPSSAERLGSVYRRNVYYGRTEGFDWYSPGYTMWNDARVRGTYIQQANAKGIAVGEPDLIADCTPKAPNCSVAFPYRGAGIWFWLPLAELSRASTIRKTLTTKLEGIRVLNPKRAELLN